MFELPIFKIEEGKKNTQNYEINWDKQFCCNNESYIYLNLNNNKITGFYPTFNINGNKKTLVIKENKLLLPKEWNTINLNIIYDGSILDASDSSSFGIKISIDSLCDNKWITNDFIIPILLIKPLNLKANVTHQISGYQKKDGIVNWLVWGCEPPYLTKFYKKENNNWNLLKEITLIKPYDDWTENNLDIGTYKITAQSLLNDDNCGIHCDDKEIQFSLIEPQPLIAKLNAHLVYGDCYHLCLQICEQAGIKFEHCPKTCVDEIWNITNNQINDGKIAVNILSGNAPYTYYWTGPDIEENTILQKLDGLNTNELINNTINKSRIGEFGLNPGDLYNLSEGWYGIKIIDGIGQEWKGTQFVSAPKIPLLSIIRLEDVKKWGELNGYVELSIDGETPTYVGELQKLGQSIDFYNENWIVNSINKKSTVVSFDNLESGFYNFKLKDCAKQEVDITFEIKEPSPLIVSVKTQNCCDPDCLCDPNNIQINPDILENIDCNDQVAIVEYNIYKIDDKYFGYQPINNPIFTILFQYDKGGMTNWRLQERDALIGNCGNCLGSYLFNNFKDWFINFTNFTKKLYETSDVLLEQQITEFTDYFNVKLIFDKTKSLPFNCNQTFQYYYVLKDNDQVINQDDIINNKTQMDLTMIQCPTELSNKSIAIIKLSEIDLIKFNTISLTELEDNNYCSNIIPFEWTFTGNDLNAELNEWVNQINQNSVNLIAFNDNMDLKIVWNEQLPTCCNYELKWRAIEMIFGHITEIGEIIYKSALVSCCTPQTGNKEIVLPSIKPIQNIFCEDCPPINPCEKNENSGGSIQVDILSGNPSYNIQLQSKPPLLQTQLTTTNFKGLNKGFYLLNVSDDKGQTYSEQIEIKAPTPLEDLIEIQVKDAEECLGYGEIKIIHKKDPISDPCYDCIYDYLWNTGENSTYLIKKEGTYTVSIIPRQPCCQTPIKKTVKIEAPVCLEINTNILIDKISFCNNNQLGSAGVDIVTGNGGYSYKWSDKCLCNQTAKENLILKSSFNDTSYRQNLLDGSYVVTVIDDKGQCTCSDVIIIKKPNDLCIVPKSPQKSQISAYKMKDGKVEVSLSSNPLFQGNGDIQIELYKVDNCADTPCGTNCDTEILNNKGLILIKLLTLINIKLGERDVLFDNLEHGNYIIRAIDNKECVISNCLCYSINDKPNPCITEGPYITQINTEPDLIQIKSGEIKNFEIDIDVKRFECCFNDGELDLKYEDAEWTIFQYPIISFNSIITNNPGGATITENGKKLILNNPYYLDNDEGKSQIVKIKLNYNGKDIVDDRIILYGKKPCFPDIIIPLKIDVCCKPGCCDDITCCPDDISKCCCDGVFEDGVNKGKLKKDIICADPNHVLFKTCCTCKDLESRNPNALKGPSGICKTPNSLIDPFYKNCCNCRDLNLPDLITQCQINPSAPHLTDCCDCKNPLNIELRKQICANPTHPDYTNCCQCNDPSLPKEIKDIITANVCQNPSPTDIIDPNSQYNKCCDCKSWSNEVKQIICGSGPTNPAYYKTYIENGVQKPCCDCSSWSLAIKKSVCGSGSLGSNDTYLNNNISKPCCDCKDVDVSTEMINRICIDTNIGTPDYNKCCNCQSWSSTKKNEICSNPSNPEFNSSYVDPISGLTLKCCCTEIVKNEVNGWQKHSCCLNLECGNDKNKICCRCEDIDPSVLSLLCSASDYNTLTDLGINISQSEYDKYKLECCQCCDENKPAEQRELNPHTTWPVPAIGQGGIPFDPFNVTPQRGKLIFNLAIPCCNNSNPKAGSMEQLIIKESSIKGFTIPTGEGTFDVNTANTINTIENYELVLEYNKFSNEEALKLEQSGGKVNLKITSERCCFDYNVQLDLPLCCKQDINHTGNLPATICRPRYEVKKYYMGDKPGRIVLIFSNSFHGDTFRIRYKGEIVAMSPMAKARKNNQIIDCWTPDNYINLMYQKWTNEFNDNQRKQVTEGFVVSTNGTGTFPDAGVNALNIFPNSNYINEINNIEGNFITSNNLPNNSISWLGRQRDRAVGDGRIGFNYNPTPGNYEIEIEIITYSPINFYALYCPCQYENYEKYVSDNSNCSFNDICTNGSTCIDKSNTKQTGSSLPTLSGRRDCQNKEPQCPQHILPNSTENFITKNGNSEANRVIKYGNQIFKKFNPTNDYFAIWEYHKSGNNALIPDDPNRKTQQGMIDNNISDSFLGTYSPNICISNNSTVNSGCGMQGPPFCYSCNAWTEQTTFTTTNLGNGYYCIDNKYSLKYGLYGNYDNNPDGRRFTLEYLLWAGSIPYLTIASLDKKCFSCNQSGTTYSISNYTIDYPDYAVNSNSNLPQELKTGQYFYDYENPNNQCGIKSYYTDKDGKIVGYYDFPSNTFIMDTSNSCTTQNV